MSHFSRIICYYKKNGYNINVLRQIACLVVNPIAVDNFAFLLNARRWNEPWTLRRFRLKYLSIDERVGADVVSLVRPTGVKLLDFFCSSIQLYVLLNS